MAEIRQAGTSGASAKEAGVTPSSAVPAQAGRKAVDFYCPACGTWCGTSPANTLWLRTRCINRSCGEYGKGRTLRK